MGDRINDAPGLAASVGIGVASGTDFARETADILLLEPGLAPLPTLVETARRMRKVVRQNLVWATAYNAQLIPFAATGHLTPVWAALAMLGSGLLVVLNALRLQRGGGAGPDAARGTSGSWSLGAAARARILERLPLPARTEGRQRISKPERRPVMGTRVRSGSGR